MKTIKEASESLEFNRGLIQSNPKLMITESFNSGVEFAQRWIPVSEELPEDGEIVLITIEDCHIDVVAGIFNGIDWFCRLSVPTGQPDFIINDKVTHWRPIEYK